MPRIGFLEGTPEATVFANTTAELINRGWSIERIQTGGDEKIGLVLATPDFLRLLAPHELVDKFQLREQDQLLSPGFAVDYDHSEDRSYVLYHGKFDMEAVSTLAGIAALTDSEP